jgi:hypothetical protein
MPYQGNDQCQVGNRISLSICHISHNSLLERSDTQILYDVLHVPSVYLTCKE